MDLVPLGRLFHTYVGKDSLEIFYRPFYQTSETHLDIARSSFAWLTNPAFRGASRAEFLHASVQIGICSVFEFTWLALKHGKHKNWAFFVFFLAFAIRCLQPGIILAALY